MLEHRLYGSNVKCLTSIMMVRVRVLLGSMSYSICQICHQAEETLEHFILDCTVLEPVRRPALDAILRIAYELLHRPLERDQLL